MADEGPQENSAGGSEDSGLSANPDRPKRAGPTLDLDAAEVSDKPREAEPNVERPEPVRRPMAGIVFAAIVSAIFGGGAAALVIAAAWWTGWPGLNASPPPLALPANTAATDALAARVAKIESAAGAPAGPASDPALAERVDAAEKLLEAVRLGLAAAHTQTEQLAAAVEEIKAAPHEASPSPVLPPPTDLSPINDRMAQLESATKAIAAETARSKPPPAASDVPLRRVVAAALLDLSVRQGEPYAAALAAAKPLAPNADALKPLEPFAATGVPSANALGRELLAMASKLSPPAQASSVTGSIVDRLEAGAARLVRIQRTDVPIGSDRNAIVARATAAAQRNDLADARDAALAASRQFAADMMAALSKPAP